MAWHQVYIFYLLVAFQNPVHTQGQRQFIKSGHGDPRTILEFCLPHKSEHTENSPRNSQTKSKKHGLYPKVQCPLPLQALQVAATLLDGEREESSLAFRKQGYPQRTHLSMYTTKSTGHRVKRHSALPHFFGESDVKVCSTTLLFLFFPISIVDFDELLSTSKHVEGFSLSVHRF